VSVSLDFLEILGRRKKNKISQGGVWADLTPPFVTVSTTSQHQKLQQDLDSLFYWSQEWQMLFIVQCRKIQCNAFWS